MGDGGGSSTSEKLSSQREGDRGKILRFTVNKEGSVMEKHEHAKGLRNPWKCTFDFNDDLFCADVGENR